MSRPERPHPALNAMLICDQAIQEQGTNKWSLIGIFESITATDFNFIHPLTVYAKITDAEGEYEFKLELVRLDDLMVIGSGIVTGTIGDRMGVAELVFQIRVRFERAGRYEFRLYANDRPVGIKAFSVVQES